MSKRFRRFLFSFLISKTLLSNAFLLLFCVSAFAQSSMPDFPLPVTSNEINSQIPARSLGDARTTNHFWVFEAEAGDVFINIVVENFNGDIDVFLADNLKPLTKLKLFADSGSIESGRVIYVRKRERLILRVSGKSPNDNLATYRIKFAGSFQAVSRDEDAPPLPTVSENQPTASGARRVNSVGTIIEEPPVAIVAATKATDESAKAETTPVVSKEEPAAEIIPKVVVTSTIEEPKESSESPKRATKRPRRSPPIDNGVPVLFGSRKRDRKIAATPMAKNNPENKPDDSKSPESDPNVEKTDTAKKKEAKPAPVDPLANVKLTVVLKSGKEFSFAMNEVQRFGVEKGILTVVKKDGTASRHPIVEVQRLTIE